MKKTFFAAASAAFALSSAYAECPLNATVETTVLAEKYRSEHPSGGRYEVIGYSPVTSDIALTEAQREFLRTEKGYIVVNSGATFSLKSSEFTDGDGFRSDYIAYALKFSPEGRNIWTDRQERWGASASRRIHADNQRVLSATKDIDGKMSKTNDPSELNDLQTRKDSLLRREYRHDLDIEIPARSPLDLALAALPKCGDK